ncbi:MAG: hypothetical protein ABI306_04415 [Caulobacteraceae bacterium]
MRGVANALLIARSKRFWAPGSSSGRGFSVMAPRKKDDPPYYPLGFVSGSAEIREWFPLEAELLGTFVIIWNRHEMRLRQAFVKLTGARSKTLIGAIWDRQPTHQAKRALLSLALRNVKLNEKQRQLLELSIDRSKTIADGRNDLIHAEYVMSARHEMLAKVSSPNSTKPPRYRRVTAKDLERAIDELEQVAAITDALNLELADPAGALRAETRRLADEMLAKRLPPPPQNQQSGSRPRSAHRTRAQAHKPPHQS